MLSTVAEVLGLLLIAAGCALAWLPLGLVAAGGGLLLLARAQAKASVSA